MYMRKTTVWLLCSIFSNGGHVFQRINNPHMFYAGYPNIFITSLVPIEVVSEEMSFEKLLTTKDEDGRQVMVTP